MMELATSHAHQLPSPSPADAIQAKVHSTSTLKQALRSAWTHARAARRGSPHMPVATPVHTHTTTQTGGNTRARDMGV